MFFISKSVTDGIQLLGEREEVKRELAAIRATPGFEVYANAIAEGPGDGATPIVPEHTPPARAIERPRSGG